MDLDLKGKRALVTGGSRGLGRAITLTFARQGINVITCYRKEGDAVASLRKELQEIGIGGVVQADVSQLADVTRLIEECRARLGGLDILVNNAGGARHSPYDELTLEDWHAVLANNLTSTHLVTQAALPLLARGASVINMGSGIATRGIPARAHYMTAKAGLMGLTRALCKELGPRGIRVNNLAPGVVQSDALSPEKRSRYESMAALGRLATTEDIADVVLFFASDLSRFVSGTTDFRIDGGS